MKTTVVGATVTYLKLHAPLYISGVGQSAATINTNNAQEVFKNVKMWVVNEGILLQTTAKNPDPKSRLYTVLITTYESAVIDLPPDLKVVEPKGK